MIEITSLILPLLALGQVSQAAKFPTSSVVCTTEYSTNCHDVAYVTQYERPVTDVEYVNKTIYSVTTIALPPITAADNCELCRTVYHTVTPRTCESASVASAAKSKDVLLQPRAENGDDSSVRRTRSRYGDCATAVNCRTTYLDHSEVHVTHVHTVTLPASTVYLEPTDTIEVHSTITVTCSAPPITTTAPTTTSCSYPPLASCYTFQVLSGETETDGRPFQIRFDPNVDNSSLVARLGETYESGDVVFFPFGSGMINYIAGDPGAQTCYKANQAPTTGGPSPPRQTLDIFFNTPDDEYYSSAVFPDCTIVGGILRCQERDGSDRQFFQYCRIPGGDSNFVGLDAIAFEGYPCTQVVFRAISTPCPTSTTTPTTTTTTTITAAPAILSCFDLQASAVTDDRFVTLGAAATDGRQQGAAATAPTQSADIFTIIPGTQQLQRFNDGLYANQNSIDTTPDQRLGGHTELFFNDPTFTPSDQRSNPRPQCFINPTNNQLSCTQTGANDGRSTFQTCSVPFLGDFIGLDRGVNTADFDRTCTALTLTASPRTCPSVAPVCFMLSVPQTSPSDYAGYNVAITGARFQQDEYVAFLTQSTINLAVFSLDNRFPDALWRITNPARYIANQRPVVFGSSPEDTSPVRFDNAVAVGNGLSRCNIDAETQAFTCMDSNGLVTRNVFEYCPGFSGLRPFVGLTAQVDDNCVEITLQARYYECPESLSPTI